MMPLASSTAAVRCWRGLRERDSVKSFSEQIAEKLVREEYWRRTWTMQEVVLVREVVVLLGLIKARERWDCGGAGTRPGLKELLGLTVESETLDLRNKIYALLGMIGGRGSGSSGIRWSMGRSGRRRSVCEAFSASHEMPLKIRFSASEPLCLEVWDYKVGNVASVFLCGPDPRRGVTCCADYLGDIARRFGPCVGVEGLLKAFLCARLCAAADAESAIQKMVEAVVSEEPKVESHEELEKLEEERIMRYLDPGIEETLHKASFKNCLFLTDNPFVAMGPKSVGEGDVVCVLGGGRIPFVLRPIEGTVDGFKLAGVCYVYGIMNGEWILKHGNVDVKRFRLW